MMRIYTAENGKASSPNIISARLDKSICIYLYVNETSMYMLLKFIVLSLQYDDICPITKCANARAEMRENLAAIGGSDAA